MFESRIYKKTVELWIFSPKSTTLKFYAQPDTLRIYFLWNLTHVCKHSVYQIISYDLMNCSLLYRVVWGKFGSRGHNQLYVKVRANLKNIRLMVNGITSDCWSKYVAQNFVFYELSRLSEVNNHFSAFSPSLKCTFNTKGRIKLFSDLRFRAKYDP